VEFIFELFHEFSGLVHPAVYCMQISFTVKNVFFKMKMKNILARFCLLYTPESEASKGIAGLNQWYYVILHVVYLRCFRVFTAEMN
jgi:hypothetical protein